jgi:cytochrome oxidase assembly protein ShyY1
VYRFLLSRRWLGLLAGAMLVAAGCLALGDWQLHRLAHRHERNDLIRTNLAHAPVTPDRLLRVGTAPPESAQWRRVRATGHWDSSHQLLVRLRPFEGDVGFYVLTPLVTDAGPAVLVNRGWVPAGAGGASVPRVAAPGTTDVTVTGRLRPSEDPATGAAPPTGQITRIDVPGLARRLPYDVYGGFLELTRQDPPAVRSASAPRLIPAPQPSEGPHLAYAVQWALFACMALGGYVVLARREAADLRAGGGAAGPAQQRDAVRRVPEPRA